MKLLLADDHAIIRRGLKFLLDTIVGKIELFETETCKGIQDLVKVNEISHLILDMQLQDGNVMEVLNNLRSEFPDVFILIYTMSPEEIFAKPVLRLGANGFLKRLLEVLAAEIDKGGLAPAIGVCRDKAPQMAKEASEKSGWQIRRGSLKNRNPKAVPDSWEKAALEDFDRRVAAGENPAGIEKAEVVTEGGAKLARYMKALPTQDICLNCHGKAERVPPEVKARLNELYPDDKGTGYGLGQVRGAITIKRPI